MSQFFCTKGTRSTQRKSCCTTKVTLLPFGGLKGCKVKTENKKIAKKKQNSEPYVLMFSSVNEVKFASATYTGRVHTINETKTSIVA